MKPGETGGETRMAVVEAAAVPNRSAKLAMQEESIYNLIEKPVVVEEKPPLYKSQFKKQAPKVVPGEIAAKASVKMSAGTIGPAKVQVRGPQQFLKRREKDKVLPKPTEKAFEYKDRRKPAVPNRKEQPIMGLTTTKNFLVSNAVEAILATPKQPTNSDVRYVDKPDYGKKPKYLDQVKREIQEEYQYISGLQEQEMRPDHERSVRLLSADERRNLLAGLKEKWEKINITYQKLSFTMSTDSKKARKEALERQLEQLEQDIEKLQRNHVYVLDE